MQIQFVRTNPVWGKQIQSLTEISSLLYKNQCLARNPIFAQTNPACGRKIEFCADKSNCWQQSPAHFIKICFWPEIQCRLRKIVDGQSWRHNLRRLVNSPGGGKVYERIPVAKECLERTFWQLGFGGCIHSTPAPYFGNWDLSIWQLGFF